MQIKLDVKTKINKDEVMQGLKRVLWLSANKVHQLAVQKVPVDTGRLKNSLILTPVTLGYSEYTISDGVEYGAYVEFGTRPHPVSYKYFEGWARRKLGDSSAAFAIAQSIKKYGTRPQPFMRPALAEVKSFWVKNYMQKVFSPELRTT